MERLSKSTFKLRSGNKPSPMELSGANSPMKDKRPKFLQKLDADFTAAKTKAEEKFKAGFRNPNTGQLRVKESLEKFKKDVETKTQKGIGGFLQALKKKGKEIEKDLKTKFKRK